MKRIGAFWLAFIGGISAVIAQPNTSVSPDSILGTIDSLMASASRFSVAGVLAIGLYFLARAYQKKDEALAELNKRHEDVSSKVLQDCTVATTENTSVLREVRKALETRNE